MSMHTRFYLGPVARVEIARKPVTDTGCVAVGCSGFHRHGGGNFCNMCGAAYGKYEVPNRGEAVDHLDLFGGDEALTSCLDGDAKHRLFTPNVGRPGVKLRYFDRDEVEEVFGSLTMEKEIAAFRKAFAAEIEELRKAYGRVEVVWMLCSDVL